jgi:hypothetical protein
MEWTHNEEQVAQEKLEILTLSDLMEKHDEFHEEENVQI